MENAMESSGKNDYVCIAFPIPRPFCWKQFGVEGFLNRVRRSRPLINNEFVEKGGMYCEKGITFKIVDRFPDGPQFTAVGLKRRGSEGYSMPARTNEILSHWITKLVDDGSIHKMYQKDADRGGCPNAVDASEDDDKIGISHMSGVFLVSGLLWLVCILHEVLDLARNKGIRACCAQESKDRSLADEIEKIRTRADAEDLETDREIHKLLRHKMETEIHLLRSEVSVLRGENPDLNARVPVFRARDAQTSGAGTQSGDVETRAAEQTIGIGGAWSA